MSAPETYATTETATEWGLSYPDESVEVYGDDKQAALDDLHYSRLMEQKGNPAYAGCSLVMRTVVVKKTAWAAPDGGAS